MKKSSLLKLLLVCAILLGTVVLVAACRTQEATPTPAATPTAAPAATPQPDANVTPPADNDGFPAFMNPAGTLPIVNEPVTISVTVSQQSGFDFEGNPITEWFENETGVHVDWMQVPSADWGTRLNLMLATGDLTDVIVSGLGTHARVFFYAQLGVFRAITDYLDPFAPELMDMFYHLPSIHADMIMPDGHIYGFPSIDDAFHTSMPQKLWINTHWLDVLDLPMPRTTEEFYNTLVAFRDLDPNQNGINDEIPFAGAQAQGHQIETILGRFVTTDMSNRMIVENGQITPVFNTPEWREGLRFANRMYTSGLVAPDTFVQDRNGLRAMGDHPNYNIVGVYPGLWLGQMVTVDIENQEGRWNDFRVIPYLETPDGRRMNFIRPLAGNHRAAITSNISDELMPVAVRWLDNFMTEISTLKTIQGQEDVHWRWADPGTVSIAGGQARWERIISPEGGGSGANDMWGGQPMPNWRSHDWRLSEAANRTIIEQETLLYDETRIMFPYRNDIDIIVPVLIFDEEQSAELVDIQAPINSFVTENIARFTVGDLCLDNDWDWYIRELEVMGLARLIELMQTALDQRQ